ncbi:MAG: glycosyltransferase family 39 protein [Acidobacteria bacterium]|nr:glycosyltransferase family 39 protein [Acidobacteriota bacterium]
MSRGRARSATGGTLLERFTGRFGTTTAVALALVAQTLLSNKAFGTALGIVPGVSLYLVAAVVYLMSWRARDRSGAASTSGGEPGGAGHPPAWEWGLIILILLGGLYLRLYRIDFIPPGLNNDEAINALEASEIMKRDGFPTVTERGLQRESLFHYLAAISMRNGELLSNLMGAMPAVFGLRTIAVRDPAGREMLELIFPLRVVSIGIGMITILALYLFARSRFGPRVALLAALLLAVSPWHLLYSRVGLRAILAPLFAIATIGFFLRAMERGRRPDRPVWHTILDHAAWGVLLGLGLWTYTSFRVVPVAILLFLLLHRFVDPSRSAIGSGERRPILVGIGVAAVLTVLNISLSGLGLLGFFLRGAYASLPGVKSFGANLLHSVTMLNYLPMRYGVVQTNDFIGDGVSAVYPLLGFEPETVPVAAFATLGLIGVAWSMTGGRRERTLGFLGLTILALWVLVGPTGPSLTRMLLLVPWVSLLAALVAWQMFDELSRLAWRPGRWIAVAAVAGLAIAAPVQGFQQHFLRVGRSERAMKFFWPTQTIMGIFSRTAVPPGSILYVLHSYGRETITYLIGDRPDLYLINDPATLDLQGIGNMKRSVAFVIEKSEYSRPFAEVLRYLINEYRAYADVREYADPRFDPDNIIFYLFAISKDASGRPVAPPGAEPSLLPGAGPDPFGAPQSFPGVPPPPP